MYELKTEMEKEQTEYSYHVDWSNDCQKCDLQMEETSKNLVVHDVFRDLLRHFHFVSGSFIPVSACACVLWYLPSLYHSYSC